MTVQRTALKSRPPRRGPHYLVSSLEKFLAFGKRRLTHGTSASCPVIRLGGKVKIASGARPSPRPREEERELPAEPDLEHSSCLARRRDARWYGSPASSSAGLPIQSGSTWMGSSLPAGEVLFRGPGSNRHAPDRGTEGSRRISLPRLPLPPPRSKLTACNYRAKPRPESQAPCGLKSKPLPVSCAALARLVLPGIPPCRNCAEGCTNPDFSQSLSGVEV